MTAPRDGGRERDDRLPTIPPVTPEQQAEIDAMQAKRAKLLNISMSDDQREFARAAAMISSYEAYDELPPSAIGFYAEALVTVGEFEKAYELTQNPFYKDILEAITGESKECDCPDTSSVEIVNGQPQTVTYSRHFTRKKIYLRDKGTWAELKMCNVCQRLSI